MANGDEQTTAVDPRAEARARLADRYDVRVLQPSPPAVGDGPWFADDPVRAPVASGRPTVSPVANGDVTWDELAADDPALADWCADRWLGAWRPLAPIGDPVAFAGTRDALHAVAEEVVSPARERATSKIGLRATHRGFGTPFFADQGVDTQLRVDGTDLVTVRGPDVSRQPLSQLPLVLASETRKYNSFLTPERGGGGEAVGVAVVAAWFGFGCSVLEEVRFGRPDADATRVQLWPEHFDISIDLGDEASGRRGTFGASPGDDEHPLPYLYVTHWGDVAPDRFWNDDAFGGASLGYEALLAVDTGAGQRATALEFFRTGLARLG